VPLYQNASYSIYLRYWCKSTNTDAKCPTRFAQQYQYQSVCSSACHTARVRILTPKALLGSRLCINTRVRILTQKALLGSRLCINTPPVALSMQAAAGSSGTTSVDARRGEGHVWRCLVVEVKRRKKVLLRQYLYLWTSKASEVSSWRS
jgi:hypothetical protein